MKKLIMPVLLETWLAGVLPDRLVRISKKTPWYRRSWMTRAPWAGLALMAPLAVFLAWKGIAALQARSQAR